MKGGHVRRNRNGRTLGWAAGAALALVAFSTTMACDAFKESKHERKERKKEEKEEGGDKEGAGAKSGGKHSGAAKHSDATVVRKPRDWTRFPAVVEMRTDAELVGLGDVHGGYDRLVKLLLAGKLIRGTAQGGYSWTGGRSVLVSVGDLIDKGDQSVLVLDLMMSLEEQARAAGGAVIATLGNHEAEFLADPRNKKAKREFDQELRAKGLDPASVGGGEGPYGTWLADRPVAARVNSWFFAHGGNTSNASATEIARKYQEAVDGGQWGSSFLIGDDSILEAQKWWKGGDVAKSLAALGARHVVFGHDPGAFKQPGRMAQQFDGKLFLIDMGMSPAINYSEGSLLVVHRSGRSEQAVSVDASGRRTTLWTGAS